MKELSLYFHIPYCKSKCYYCDFISYTNMENINEYFKYLLREVELYTFLHGSKVTTIFIGGGTPSIVDPKYIRDIIQKCKHVFNFDNNIEVTIECNPESLSEEKLLEYKEIGINRLSIGLQTWQNKLLKKIGRIHTKEQFENAFLKAREFGFNNINVDLIFSLPEQTLNDWVDTLNNVIGLNPEHISCYSLTVEEGTRLYEQLNQGILVLPDDELNRRMYHKAQDILSKNGYKQYEISNFSKQGFECIHNLAYWKYKEYIGFGAGAHSFFDSQRTENFTSIDEYISCLKNNNFAYKSRIMLTKSDQITEYVITGLRLLEGINKNDFYNRFKLKVDEFYSEQISKFTKNGLLFDDGESIYLTKKGLDLSNIVMCEFC